MVEQEVKKYHGWDVGTMVAISRAESGCSTTRVGDRSLTYPLNGRIYGYSVSAFQVRILPGREHCDTPNITVNVRCAYAIWQGQGYNAWTVFQTGAYKQ